MSLLRRLGRRVREVDLIVPGMVERALLRDVETGERSRMPLITIVGPPRVGSTLMYQILADAIRCFYFDNFQHTFLRYPYLAFLFSRRFLHQHTGGYRSEHGHIPGLGGMSEGNFFWPYWLDMPIEEKRPAPDPDRWRHVRAVFDAMYDRTGLPMVVSYNAHAFYLQELPRFFEKVLVVNMRRDPVANGLSLLRGRMHYRGTIQDWWSLRPRGCEDVALMDPYDQIACQIQEIYKRVHEARLPQDPLPILDVTYAELCSNPEQVIAGIIALGQQSGLPLALAGPDSVFPPFAERGPRPEEGEAAARFAELFARMNFSELWSPTHPPSRR